MGVGLDPDDLQGNAAPGALRLDLGLVPDLVVAEGDDLRSFLDDRLVDVGRGAEHGPVDRLQRLDHLASQVLGDEDLVLQTPGGLVAGDDDDELVAELACLAQEEDVPRMEEVEDPRGHYADDHVRHASTIVRPSTNGQPCASAHRRAASGARAPPESPSISHDGDGLGEPRHAGERDGELRMALSLGGEPGCGVEERNVARRDERRPEPLAELSVRELGGCRRDLADARIVVARSLSGTPVKLERWLTVIPKALRRSYRGASPRPATPGNSRAASASRSEKNGRSSRRRSWSEMAVQMRPPGVSAGEADQLGGRALREEDEVGLPLPVRGIEDQDRLAL